MAMDMKTQVGGGTGICASLVDGAIDGAPHGGPPRRRHSNNAPVSAKILDAPDDADDDGDKGEGGAVAKTDEGGDERKEVRDVLDDAQGEEKLSD